jgi:hypothetical protein
MLARGKTDDHLLRRLARDHPDVLTAYKRGDLEAEDDP